MPLVDPKTVVAFVAGGALALGAWSVGAASAASPPTAAPPAAAAAAPAAAAPAIAPAVTIPVVGRACANKRSGALSVIRAGTAKKRCAATEVMVAWPAAPPSLLAKDGSLRLTSPNKAYLLVLNNDGVGIKGPGGALLVDATSIKQFDSTGKQK